MYRCITNPEISFRSVSEASLKLFLQIICTECGKNITTMLVISYNTDPLVCFVDKAHRDFRWPHTYTFWLLLLILYGAVHTSHVNRLLVYRMVDMDIIMIPFPHHLEFCGWSDAGLYLYYRHESLIEIIKALGIT